MAGIRTAGTRGNAGDKERLRHVRGSDRRASTLSRSGQWVCDSGQALTCEIPAGANTLRILRGLPQ